MLVSPCVALWHVWQQGDGQLRLRVQVGIGMMQLVNEYAIYF